MTSAPPPNETEPRVVSFRRRGAPAGGRPAHSMPSQAPVEDLSKYERTDELDDYRHRMIVNIIAFVFLAALIAGGVWLANTMAQMRKNQDCVLSGRRGCTPVEFTPNAR
jgi:hypothetical protein